MTPHLPYVCSRLVRQRHRGAEVFASWFVVLPVTRQNHDGMLPIPTLSCDLCAQICSTAREQPENSSTVEVSCRSPPHLASSQRNTSEVMWCALLTLDQTKLTSTMLCRTDFFDHLQHSRNSSPSTSTMTLPSSICLQHPTHTWCHVRIIVRRPRTRR